MKQLKNLALIPLFVSFLLITHAIAPNTLATCPADVPANMNYCYAQGCDITGSECNEQITQYGTRSCACQQTLYNTDPNNPFGTVTNPLPTTSTTPGGGLITLLNNILRLVFVIAGIYAFIRIIIAGLGFIGAGGDPKKIEAAWSSIWQSLLGLVIIISSFAIAALIGQLLFGNPGAILNPTIYGPLS